jgi:hypothetical protein
MDIEGARILSERIAQQQHWEQADAVQQGRAPAIDPDAHRLTQIRGVLRIYDAETRVTNVNGRRSLVTRIYCKRLVEGEWRAFFDNEESLAG